MATLTTINATDLITNSRTDINTNFSNLNSSKIETSVIDTDTALAANSDAKIPSQKAVKAYVDAGGNMNASTTQKGIVQEATAAQVTSQTATGSTGARLYVNPSTLSSVAKFGGSGADGALAITSGTTTLDVGGAQVFVKNYSSISITGSASLAFTNPHALGTIIIIKCKGDMILTSSGVAIDTRGMGEAGGTGGGTAADGTAAAVNPTGTVAQDTATLIGGLGGKYNTGSIVGGVAAVSGFYTTSLMSLYRKSIFMLAGAGGGGGGGATSVTGGAGGRGGGALYIECSGALNFTTGSINTSGSVGTAGTLGANAGAGGGGGGSAGTVVVLYGTLTANTGTITSTGGTGGAGGNGAGAGGNKGDGGSGAGSVIAAGGVPSDSNGGSGGAAAGLGAGGAGGTGLGGGVGSGGTGGAGGATLVALVTANTEFA